MQGAALALPASRDRDKVKIRGSPAWEHQRILQRKWEQPLPGETSPLASSQSFKASPYPELGPGLILILGH